MKTRTITATYFSLSLALINLSIVVHALFRQDLDLTHVLSDSCLVHGYFLSNTWLYTK